MLQACASYIWGRIHPGAASLLICLSCEQSHAVLTCAADSGCRGICLYKYQKYFQRFFLCRFLNESVLMNYSDIPGRIYKSVGGFGALLAVGAGAQPWLSGTQMLISASFSAWKGGILSQKPIRRQVKEEIRRKRKETLPSSSGCWPGELPTARYS